MSFQRISVIISTYERASLLERVLYALCDQTISFDRYEIIVCDSNSMDDTKRIIEEISQKNSQCEIRHLHTKNMLSAKRNLGLANAKYEIVLVLDDDCIPEKRLIEKYLASFENNDDPNIIYCGEVRYPEEWVKQSNYFRYRDSRHFGSGVRPDLENGELDHRTIVSMNMAFRKNEIISRVGYFNESFFGYGCEDQEYGWRIQSAGFKILPHTARIHHYETSGSLGGYTKKIFHTSRDGVKNLLRECPEALWSSPHSKLLEPNHPYIFALERMKAVCFRFLLKDVFIRPIFVFLAKTDTNPAFYFPKLYRLVLAKAYINGVRQRGDVARTSDDIRHGWYNK